MTGASGGSSAADAIARARRMVDEIHEQDPARTPGGQPAELAYADRMESWVRRLVPDASPLLLLAARCQHLERWAIPRDRYPMDRAGYNAWRRALYVRQAERAREVLASAGVAAADAESVAAWVAKQDLRRNPGTQILEDAACLVFLENELDGFARKHHEYTREKFTTIIRRIWRKMSPAARDHALALDMAPELRNLVVEAVREE